MAKILVIEDEAPVRASIIDLLKVENYTPLGAENGLVGLGMACKEQPDLIICDIMMPGLDGYEVLTALHQDPATATIPFLFLTAKTDKEELRQGMNLGADDYLTKPFALAELVSAIESRLSRKRALTQVYQDKLENLSQNLANSLSHELTIPLETLMQSAGLLLECPEIAANLPEVTTVAQQIYAVGEGLNKLTQKLWLLTQLELIASDPLKVKAIRARTTQNTKTLINNLAYHKARQMGREADLKLQLQESSAKICQEWLAKLVEELLDHALRYSQVGSQVQVTTVPNYKQFILYIMDSGGRISTNYLWETGRSVQIKPQKYEQEGLGLGLTLVKKLVELYQGDLHLESVSGQKTIRRVARPR
jgi:two-component system sensor histidine kinase/response regulator